MDPDDSGNSRLKSSLDRSRPARVSLTLPSDCEIEQPMGPSPGQGRLERGIPLSRCLESTRRPQPQDHRLGRGNIGIGDLLPSGWQSLARTGR